MEIVQAACRSAQLFTETSDMANPVSLRENPC